ncbi:MAG: manganese efflux pump MntP family protein [Coprobacillaceae bacterium]
MSFFELLLISIGLAMDAFAVSVCKGLSMPRLSYKKAIIIALFFGGFQAIMPFIGYHLGLSFSDKIEAIDHWVVFILLGVIGFNMIKEALSNDDEEIDKDGSIRVLDLTMLAIATSIDALAIDIGFAFLNVDILPSIVLIGIITFILCIIGVKVGNVFGEKYSSKAEFAGGSILLLIGIKVLLEHLFF